MSHHKMRFKKEDLYIANEALPLNAAKSTHWVILIHLRFLKAKMLWLMSTPPNVDVLDIFYE